MSHDIEASYAAAEVARRFLAAPANCFATPPASGSLSVYAAREGRHAWPHADGVIELAVASGGTTAEYNIAVEFKRPNEGLHGVLTAIGQSHAYLRKGYAGAIIVIPEAYPGFSDPGPYVRDVLDLTSQSKAIGVITYGKPDMSKVSPFAGRLSVHRQLEVDTRRPVAVAHRPSRTETQWAHVREGSTEPDALFKYLQAVKLLSGGGIEPHHPKIPTGLKNAIKRLKPGMDPEKYLANCPYDALKDRAWRHFWFKYILHDAALPGWKTDTAGSYILNGEMTLIERSDGKGNKRFFFGKSNSPKNRIVGKLNAGSISIDDAHDALVENYSNRAHSYREDIDSGCEHLGFVDSDGRLTDAGYQFVDACERYGTPNEGLPRAYFLGAVLGEGALGAFLHYVYRLSEERFGANPLAFTAKALRGHLVFDHEDYLEWLEDEMANRLHVLRKVSARGGTKRKPFQAELALLRNLGIVGRNYRIGVGLVINWPEFQEAVGYQSVAA